MAEMKIDITKLVNNVIEQLEIKGYKPIRKGKWKDGKCSICRTSLEELFEGDFYYDCDELHYCPNCGARMEQEG